MIRRIIHSGNNSMPTWSSTIAAAANSLISFCDKPVVGLFCMSTPSDAHLFRILCAGVWFVQHQYSTNLRQIQRTDRWVARQQLDERKHQILPEKNGTAKRGSHQSPAQEAGMRQCGGNPQRTVGDRSGRYNRNPLPFPGMSRARYPNSRSFL